MIVRRAIKAIGGWFLAVVVMGVLIASPATARDAAFIQPGSSNAGGEEEALKVEPKNEIDIGDTVIHATRRTTLFFVNESNGPVQVESVVVNSDANVQADVTNDDCSKQGTIAPTSRCSLEISITPSGSGEWSAQVLLTHNGAGRIARARLTGKTAGGTGTDERKETGLAVSAKESNPVDFGDLPVGAKAARSALMVNDSPDPITLYSIDVIEADNGLKVLDGGCAVDMELKPGESCPVTIVWEPGDAGQVSTDLIIRHSGRKGFAVVPVRGKTKEDAADTVSTKDEKPSSSVSGKSSAPLPPTADQLDNELSKAATKVSASALAAPKSSGDKTLRLIGTVGNRAVLLLPDGTTRTADLDDEIPLGNDQFAKITSIDSKSIKAIIDGKEKTIKLAAAAELVSKASAAAAKQSKEKDTSGKSTKSSATKTSTALPAATVGVGEGTMKGAVVP